MKRWLSVTGLSLAVVLGGVGGLFLAILSTPRPVFSFDQASVISWRGNDERVPAGAEVSGWSAPMFYTTPAEGAPDGPPEGRYPTGVWAPGDTVARALTIRNVDPGYMVRLEKLQVELAGDLNLLPWLSLTVYDSAGRLQYQGGLTEFRGAHRPLDLLNPLLLPPGARETLTFAVAFDRETENPYQGLTVRANIALIVSRYAHRTPIDVHPGSWPNPINPGSRGDIPVAVNGTATLDVTALDWQTARFGPGRATPQRAGYEDWNQDGRMDLVLHVDTRESGVTCGMSEATLTVATADGQVYEGSDAIATPSCR